MSASETAEAADVDTEQQAPEGWRDWPWARIFRLAVIGAAVLMVAMSLTLALLLQLSGGPGAANAWVFVGLTVLIAVVVIRTPGPGSAPTAPSPRDMISEVHRHVEATGRLLRALEDELTTRTKVLQQLQEDAERYEKLSSLNAEQAKVIDDYFSRQFKRQSRVSWWLWVMSLVLAVVFGFIVNWLSTPLLNWITN